MNEHYCKEILCSGPDYAEGDATHCEDNDRVGNRVERTRIRAESFNFASMSKNKTRGVRQAKNQGHQYHAADFRFEGGGQLGLDETAKEEFFHESYFEQEPSETNRQSHKELKSCKGFTPKRGAATAEEILEAHESSAYHEDDGEMAAS